MYAAVSSLKDFLKISTVITDNAIFKLHYQCTCLILIMFSVIVSTKQFFGDPIDCMTSTKDAIPTKVLDNYCWIHSTFTLPRSMDKDVGKEVIYPGIEKATPKQDKTYHAYYQWVCFFLFLQAIMFYMPRYFWKLIEGHKIQQIVIGLNVPIIDKDSDKESKVNKLAKYIEGSLGNHTFYSLGFALCEVLNFVNVVGQMYFTNAFLGGEFTTYGTEVVWFSQMNQVNRTDPMIQVFPRMTMCTFRKFGPSGDIQFHDALCVLPANVFNEKIFIFQWFWFVIVAAVTGISLLFRLAVLIFKDARYFVSCTRSRYTNKDPLRSIVRKCSYGDWFLLHLLSKNVNKVHYSDLIEELDRLMGNGEFPNDNLEKFSKEVRIHRLPPQLNLDNNGLMPDSKVPSSSLTCSARSFDPLPLSQKLPVNQSGTQTAPNLKEYYGLVIEELKKLIENEIVPYHLQKEFST